MRRPVLPPDKPWRVLICPDKFKGTLTATAAATAIAAGWRRGRPGDLVTLLPISDGGDGFGELLGSQLAAREQRIETVDAAHRPIRATWWWEPRTQTAVVESARIIGLAGLPAGRFHPFDLDTFGLGAVLRAVAKLRPQRCWIGIGGSATNDAGFGLARGLGWHFLDAARQPITRWTDLIRLATVVPPRRPLALAQTLVAVDVRNRLLGVEGCTRVYGPQKGLRPADFEPAEANLRRLARMVAVARPDLRGVAQSRGTGAAGGLGYGLRVFAGARLVPGFGLFAEQTGLEARIRDADVVITGEGAIDATTLGMGKGVGDLARRCHRRGIPCVGLAGSVRQPRLAGRVFARVAGIVPDVAGQADAIREPVRWLTELAFQIARQGTIPVAPQRPSSASRSKGT